jgi:hypothetical protein
MDRLTAFVAISHLKLRLRYLSRHPEIIEGIDMTPKLQGLASAMAKLKHDVEFEADKLLARVQDASAASAGAFAKSHQVLDATKKDVADIEEFIASMVGSNGAPAGPLDVSSATSVQSQPSEPAASWGAKTA